MSLTISELNKSNKNLAKSLDEANKKNQELLLEIERLKNNNNKDSSILQNHQVPTDIKK